MSSLRARRTSRSGSARITPVTSSTRNGTANDQCIQRSVAVKRFTRSFWLTAFPTLPSPPVGRGLSAYRIPHPTLPTCGEGSFCLPHSPPYPPHLWGGVLLAVVRFVVAYQRVAPALLLPVALLAAGCQPDLAQPLESL